jgi:threonine 3-dehydrogenase
MSAIVKTKESIGAEYLEVEIPEVGPREVLVKVKACAICGTDVHMYEWNSWAAENVKKAYGPLPRIMGHEVSGIIEAVGKDVEKVKPGDRVAAETHIPCGKCFLCRTGNQFNCQYLKRFKNGIFAEYALIPEFSAEKIPDNIPFEIASMFEPFGVAVHGASYVRLVGEPIAIIGAGPIGLFSLLMAKVMGSSFIIVIEPSKFRRDLAKKIGADKVLDPRNEDIVNTVKELTKGLGVGVVFETSGNINGVKKGFEILRKCGSYLMIGLSSEPIVLDAGADIVWKAAKVYGVYGRDNFTTWEILKNILERKKIDLEQIITHRFKFKDYKEAFELCRACLTGKVILLPK